MVSSLYGARRSLCVLTFLPLLLSGCGSGSHQPLPGNPSGPSNPPTGSSGSASTAFSVSSITPAPGTTGVALNTPIKIVFSSAADASTVNTTNIQVMDPKAVSGAVAYDASTSTATFTPSSALVANSTYTVRVSGVTSSTGTGLASPFTSNFSTSAASSSGGSTGGSAQFTVLHTFENTDGANPNAALIEDASGNLYSTTQYGGKYQNGTAFKLTPSGTLTTLHQFGYPSTDGAQPMAPLVADANGNLYGTTYVGGKLCEGSNSGSAGCGVVFKIDPAGNESILYSFGTNPQDGANPPSGLILDSAGNLYGTTLSWNLHSTAYEISPSGAETILHSFPGGSDGILPYGSLVMDASGTLWGTTSAGGGTSACVRGCGTVFKLQHTSSGWTETVTYQFTGGKDGGVPYAGLTYDPVHQVFYGTTRLGGTGTASDCTYDNQTLGCGVVFKLDATGTKETVLHDFSGQADGGWPRANLLLDSSGNLLGTTTIGGDLSCPHANGCGTIFEITPNGQFSTLHTFAGGSDGGVPRGALLQDKNNPSVYYGTTAAGGDPKCQTQYGDGPGCGVVFKLTH